MSCRTKRTDVSQTGQKQTRFRVQIELMLFIILSINCIDFRLQIGCQQMQVRLQAGGSQQLTVLRAAKCKFSAIIVSCLKVLLHC